MADVGAVVDAAVFVRNARVEEAPLSGEMMLFDPEAARFFVLNRTMALVWRHCDGRHTMAMMLEAMEREFSGVDRAAAESDLQRALDEALALGLVVAKRSTETTKV